MDGSRYAVWNLPNVQGGLMLLRLLRISANAVGRESEVLRVAVKTGLTAYDASYVAVARQMGTVLITEDGKLRKKASWLVPVVSVDEL